MARALDGGLSGGRRLCVLGSAASPHVVARAAAMTSLGYAVTLLSPLPLPPRLAGTAAGLQVRCCGGGTGLVGRLRLATGTLRALLATPADAWHAHYAAEYGTWLAALSRRRPLVVSVMGGDVLFDEQGTLGPLGRWLTRLALRHADLVTVKSPRLAEAVRGFGVPAARIVEVAWGVDLERFRSEPAAVAALRREWDVDDDAPVLFSPRMLQPFYRQDLMLEALPAVLARAPRACLVLSRLGEDQPFVERLQKRARELGVEPRLRLVEALAPERMPAAYAAADLVLSLPASDGLPQAVLEAQAVGTPVVAAPAPGLETLQADEPSVLFADAEPAAVAAAVLRLHVDAQLVAALVAAGRRLVAARASLAAAAARVDEHLRALIDASRG